MKIRCGSRPAFQGTSDRVLSCRGITLIELLVAVSISGIVALAAGRLYLSYLKSYNLQQELTDMHMNAHYTMKRLSDEIMQAGADLPDTSSDGYDAIIQAGGVYDSVVVMENKRGAYHLFDLDVPLTSKIALSSASDFINADSCLKEDTSGTVSSFYISSVDTSADPDTIEISGNVSFGVGDQLYAVRKQAYYLDGNNNLCLNNDQTRLAEDIDSLYILFLDKNKNPTTDWVNMLFCSIFVQTRTATPDNKYSHPVYNDGYRRLALDMEFRLRNKF